MSRRFPLSPILLLAAAGTMLGAARKRAPDSQMMLRQVGQTGAAHWDTAFVQHAGYWSHYDHATQRSVWPLPPTNDCNEWACWANESGVLSTDVPDPGDIFLQWSPLDRQFV